MAITSCAPTQLGSWWLARQIGTRPVEYPVRIERSVPLVAEDGITLAADIYHPVGLDKSPTILVRIPYTKTFQNTLLATVVGRYWAERGYAAVIQGSRGRDESGGRYNPFVHEREDGIATLKWIAQQPWYNGRIGMWDSSYFGYTQWVLADQTAPGVSAFTIQIASSQMRGMFYQGGAFSLESALDWAVGSYGERDIARGQAALDRGYNGFPLIEADDRAVTNIPFFNEWASRPSQNDYWRAVDGDDRIKSLSAPVLLMGGWFDQHLCDGPVAFPAPVRIFVMGANMWRDEQEWPLARTKYTEFFLRSGGKANSAAGDGRLSLASPGQVEPADEYVYDPRSPAPSAGGAMLGPRAGILQQNFIEERADVLVYSTPPLDEDTEVTGPVRLILHVTTDAPNTDFTAKLVDVFPDGTAYNVSEGILRSAYAANTPTEIALALWPISRLFRQGHRIRLEVSSSNYPRFDRNPNTGRLIATETETRAAQQTVFHAPDKPSRLVLPLIPAIQASRKPHGHDPPAQYALPSATYQRPDGDVAEPSEAAS